MSVPSNPLDGVNSSNHFHILVAFKHAEDAFDQKITIESGIIGESIPNAGENVIVVNEAVSNRFTIEHALWDFNALSPASVTTTSSVGKIGVTERVSNSFLNFLRDVVLFRFNDGFPEEEHVSLSHITFVLQTIFVLGGDEETNESINVIKCNPYFFQVDSIDSMTNNAGGDKPMHMINAISSTNTVGLLRSFSALYQTTITSKDGNIQNDNLAPDTISLGLKQRSLENQQLKASRQRRLNKSNIMTNLKDIFEGFQKDLNEQKFIHKAQLQQWIRNIKDEPDTDKIVFPPTQTKPPNDNFLPIDYRIDLDPVYQSYRIDNRNMPFEQPDVIQTQSGIRTFPVTTGKPIIKIIKELMLLSRQVADDTRLPLGEKRTFKVAVTAFRKKDGNYLVNIKIRRIIVPKNTENVDTGPGEIVDDGPLHFFLNDPENRDVDIISFSSSLDYEISDVMIEQQSDSPGAGIVFGDREQGTAQRGSTTPFFKSLYNGVRNSAYPRHGDGLESAQDYGDIVGLLKRQSLAQSTRYNMVIRGNPHLLSDLNRTPNDVVNDEIGQAFIFERPEINPMYVRLTIFEDTVDDTQPDVPIKFYYDNHYQLVRVINMFGFDGTPRSFYQQLILKRTDSLMD